MKLENTSQPIRTIFPKGIVPWVFCMGALLFAILVGFNNIDVEKKHGEFFWQTHQEGVSQAHTKDEKLSPVDGFSREFPIMYNYLGDYALGYISDLLAKPPYVTQSFFYPKLLSAIFLLANFTSIYLITKSKLASLLSALLLSFGSDIIYFDAIYKVIDPNLTNFKARMHLPSIALQLGNGQSAGWLLFMPVIACIYLARKHLSLILYSLSGIGLGVLFQTHTLTFINVMTIVSVWFLASNAKENSSIEWLRWVGFVSLFFVMASFSREFGLIQLAGLWAGAFVFSIRDRNDFLRLLVMGVSAFVVSYQFIHSLINSIALKGGLELHVDASIDYRLVAGYYFIYWLLFALVLVKCKGEAEKLGVVIVACTLAFSFGQVFGFYNHQYRFVIHLCFGLFFLAPLAILKLNELDYWQIPLVDLYSRRRERWLPALVILTLGLIFSAVWSLSVYRDVKIQTGYGGEVAEMGYNTKYYNINYATKSEEVFLRALSKIPNKERVLLPPEDNYPRRLFHNSIILGTGDFRSFIPDYRYIVDKKSYKDRVFVYCSIFPKYPHFDAHYNDRYCADFNSIDRYRGNGKEALDVLGIYGINYIIQWPEINEVKLTNLYDANKIYGDDNGYLIWKTSCENAFKDGRVCFYNPVVNKSEISFSVKSPNGGTFEFCFSGANLTTNIAGIKTAASDVPYTTYGADTLGLAIVFESGIPQDLHFKFKDQKVVSPVAFTPFYYAKGALAKKGYGCNSSGV